ncbi:SMI1/KNR4 family protein [Nocardia takedensis]|uniref:SMI1/KNR4 family protein n=1 Tax=Nocardia takedensis TaxID=259390 RepID=UPI0002E07C65|nr:SMI1/KNR4 family protein [Nocardia takedensis]
MSSGVPRYRLFRRPPDSSAGWSPAGDLAVRIERGGVDADLSEIGWRTDDGDEASLTLPDLVGVHRWSDGQRWELRGEPVAEGPGPDPAVYLLFEGDAAQWLPQHPDNPLNLYWQQAAGRLPVGLSWRTHDGHSGHIVFEPTLQDGHLATVVDIQADAEHPDGIEIASTLLDGSAATKWFAPAPRAELVLTVNAERTIVGYELDSADDAPDRDPRDWEMLGFCGHEWVVLDRRQGEGFAGRLSSRAFAIEHPRTCRQLRLRILANAGSPHLQLGGLRLRTAEGPEPPPSLLGWYHRPDTTPVALRGFLVQERVTTAPPAPATDHTASTAVPTSTALPATADQWRRWVDSYSDQWLRTADEDDLEDVALTPTGLTRPPADTATLEQLETRLATELPPTLRCFYQATDGLIEAGAFGERVLSSAELLWLREAEPELVEIFGDHDELAALLVRALRIGGSEDGDHWFLDPGDVVDGEWAAYTWHPSDGDPPQRYDSFAALLAEQRRMLTEFRAQEGRPADTDADVEALLTEARHHAAVGDVVAADETLSRAHNAGSAEAGYLLAQLRLFTVSGTSSHESLLRNDVLANKHVMSAIDDAHLRGDLIPMYLAVALPGAIRPTVSFAQMIAEYADMPEQPAGHTERYDTAWEQFAATLITEPLPDPAPFDRVFAVARDLVELGFPDDAWNVLRRALPEWRPGSPLRIMPTVLVTDPVLRTIMTPERRLLAAVSRKLSPAAGNLESHS